MNFFNEGFLHEMRKHANKVKLGANFTRTLSRIDKNLSMAMKKGGTETASKIESHADRMKRLTRPLDPGGRSLDVQPFSRTRL